MWSDLRILVVGFVDENYSDTFSTLNAVVGRQAFSRARLTEKQEACVEVEGGRRLWLTYMPAGLFRDMGDAYSEGRTAELDNMMYHCVVIAMAFDESALALALRYNGVVSQTLSQKFGESFLKKQCVVIVTDSDRFVKARSEGRVTETFLEWCRGGGTNEDFKAVFHGVQERWILFNNNGSPDELKQQRQQLVDIVDTRILVGSHYTDMKFKEVEIKAAKLEKQNLDLKGELEKKTKELIETRASDVQKSEQQFSHLREKTTYRSQVLEQEVEKLKQQLEEKTVSVVERQESDSCKMMERSQVLEQQVVELKQQLGEKTKESLEKTRSVVERQESDGCKMMERIHALEKLQEKSTVESTRTTERLETVEQELTSQIEDIKGELEQTRQRSLWNRVVSLPQSLPVQTSPRLGLALLVLLVLLSLLIPLLRPAPTNRPREITMLDESLELRRYVNSKFEESTKRLREIERQITELKIDVYDKTGASNENDSERANKKIQQIEEQFAEFKKQVRIDSTVQVEEIQRLVEEKINVAKTDRTFGK